MNKHIDIRDIVGLSEAEAQKRLKEQGYNELASSKPRSGFAIALSVMREPMFLLLIGAGAVYLSIGEPREALTLLSFVFLVIGITFYQERKTERALEALRDLSSPRALVIRGKKQIRIAGREVVLGDYLVISEGDRVPADAVLLSSTNLSLDESLLTGESAPVHKSFGNPGATIESPGGDCSPFVFSGTLVVGGKGIALVRAVGADTQMGKIGTAIKTLKSEKTNLQKETAKVVRDIAFIGLGLFAIIVLAYGFIRNDWLAGILAGIALAMAMLPEEFPVVLTVFLAIGAWRISKKGVLTRQVPTLETLGSTTVLCVDKTGTLTYNKMRVKQIYANSAFFDFNQNNNSQIPEQFHQLIEFGMLASHRDPYDPMEIAINNLGNDYLSKTEHVHKNWTLVQEYPLSIELLAISHVWKSVTGKDFVIAAKGAPEAIADLCHFTKKQTDELMEKIQQMTNQGLRVLGVAQASFELKKLPGEQHDFNFKFVGLLGLEDPVRSSVSKSIEECYNAGIRVIMITGDYPGTAISVAKQIGLSPRNQVINGQQLSAMSDVELNAQIKSVNIFARVVPEQKLRIVNALKANGEVVAMTGDGVNDAPALKSAQIGIAMGGRGTDVAREAASLVLLDDDFSSIVNAVRIGRRTYDNIKKAMAYIIAVHIPIAGMALIPVMLGMPLVLLPVQIVFMEFIIDPASSVVFEAEPEEAGIMNRLPRNPKERLFSRHVLGLSILQGVSVLFIVMVIFLLSRQIGMSADGSRALTFSTLIISNLGLILTNRSWSRVILATIKTKNAALWWVFSGAIVFLGLVLYVPLLREIFHFDVLSVADLGIALGAGIISITWFEVLKLINRARGRRTV